MIVDHTDYEIKHLLITNHQLNLRLKSNATTLVGQTDTLLHNRDLQCL